jgi:hypothetical protein
MGKAERLPLSILREFGVTFNRELSRDVVEAL